MAIAINGSGTITGVSAGGIPDNTIDNGTMADDAVGIAELSASGTASSSTFLRGDNSWASAGGGKVLQVVSTTKTDTTSVASSSSFSDISGMSVAITPSATSSKILIRYYLQISGTTNMYGAMKILRDSTDICIGDAISGYTRATAMITDTTAAHGAYKMWTVANEFLDSPSSTSAITYKLQWRETTGSSRTAWLNKTPAGDNGDSNISTASTITVTEVGA
jgi:hypothetical protein